MAQENNVRRHNLESRGVIHLARPCRIVAR